mgnify:CR=1 FL=1
MHKEKNKFKRILWFVLTLLVLTLTGSTLYLQWYALEAGGNERGKNLETSYAFMYEHYPFLSHWVDSLQRENALRDTFILAEDGVRLHALYLYADTLTAHTAVAVHGYTDNAVRMLHIAYLYNHDLHYNVLLPDLRFAGQSEGDHIQMGWKDRLVTLDGSGQRTVCSGRFPDSHGGTRHLHGSGYDRMRERRTPTAFRELLCGRLRLYQRVG